MASMRGQGQDGQPFTNSHAGGDQVDVLPAQPTRTVTSGTGWRRAALLLGLVLVMLVALPRLFPAAAPPATRPAATATAGPTVTARVVAVRGTYVPAAQKGPLVGGPMPRSADGTAYLDGIPTRFDGEAVLRVRDALLRPLGTSVLVGGWYMPPVCYGGGAGRTNCASAVLSDVPVDQQGAGWLATDWLAVSSQSAEMGARIMRGRLEPDPACSIGQAVACQPRLEVTEVVWIGPRTSA
jgi:hypothetical protein